MPTAAGRRLTQAHRNGQLRIAAETVAAMRAVWQLLDPDDLDGTFEQWMIAALAAIEGRRAASAELAASYLSAFKQAEIRRAATVVTAATLDPATAATSLMVTGPISVKKAMVRGVPLAKAFSVAEAASAASAMRHALDGGRDTIRASLAADRDARGWTRVTSGNACNFCEMLAGRGAVYAADTADFQSHDGCGCSAEPVYRR